MKKHIVVDNEIRKFLMKAFGCTRMSVWRALSYDSDTDTARRIRKLALQKGGQLVGDYIPDCDTTHEEVEKTMDKRTAMGVLVDLNKYTQYQAAEAMREAANNENGAAGMSAGFGAAAMMTQAMQFAQSQQQPVQSAPAAAPQGDTKFCMECGAKIPRAAKFCMECGAKQG